MKERKETIDLKKANIFSLAVLAVTALAFAVPYILLWGKQPIQPSHPLAPIGFFLVLIVGIVVHELIHGLVWAHYAPSGFKSISFGVIWKMLTPYCHCNEPLKVKNYIKGCIAPLVVLGIVPGVLGLAIGSVAVTVFGVIFISSAAGDIMVAWRLRREPAENTVLDHPSEVGYLVYEPDND